MNNGFFGIGGNQVVTTPQGLIMFAPTHLSLTHSDSDFSRIELAGVIMTDKEAKANRMHALKNFTIIELMEEVQGRIKSGENIKERNKCN